MKIMPIDRVIIDDVVDILKTGGLIIYPTETMYGAGVDATNDEVVSKLYKYKKRPFGKPFSIAVEGLTMAKNYVELNETAINLYKHFLPGPITIISKQRTDTSGLRLAKGVASELGTVGVRIPDYELVTKIIKSFGKPITATSANASYKKRPYSVTDILENISDRQKTLINLIIDAGDLPRNEPSTVVDTTSEDLMILRQGEIKLKAGNEILSRSEENTQNAGKELWQQFEKYAGHRAIVFALEGPMGAGKTQFVKGMARAMGIKEEVVSPTFNLNSEFYVKNLRLNLEHIDVWRIQSADELETLGFSKMISDKSIMAIEWADKVANVVRKYNEEAVIVWIKINYPTAGSGQSLKENDRLINWGVL